jgi:hypothetical protein
MYFYSEINIFEYLKIIRVILSMMGYFYSQPMVAENDSIISDGFNVTFKENIPNA